MGPLSGLKVVDLTHVMAGPTCTLMLADMGADVIKIEKIPAGDDTRHMVPPKIGDEAASFLMMNRNKRGIALDLKTPGGAKVLRRLIAKADVLVENFGPGVMERLGFGYAEICKAAPCADLLLAVRLRPHRPLQASPRLRSGRAGDERHHELHRRAARRAAGQMRRAAVRHHRRHHRRHGHSRRLCPPAQNRRGPVGRNLAVRGGAGADLLAVGHRARHRRRAEGDGLGPSAQRALPGVRSLRRLDRGRRRQSKATGCARSKCSARPNSRAIRALRPAPTAWAI